MSPATTPDPSFLCRTKERVNHHLPPLTNKDDVCGGGGGGGEVEVFR
jgi:hypothetical protein